MTELGSTCCEAKSRVGIFLLLQASMNQMEEGSLGASFTAVFLVTCHPAKCYYRTCPLPLQLYVNVSVCWFVGFFSLLDYEFSGSQTISILFHLHVPGVWHRIWDMVFKVSLAQGRTILSTGKWSLRTGSSGTFSSLVILSLSAPTAYDVVGPLSFCFFIKSHFRCVECQIGIITEGCSLPA